MEWTYMKITICKCIIMGLVVRSMSAATCDTREEGLKQRLERCHERGDHFMRRHDSFRNGKRGERDMCRMYYEYRDCMSPLLSNCTNIRQDFMQQWRAVDHIMHCACVKKKADCKADLKCMRRQFKDPLVLRCDVMYRFQRKQRIYDECGLLREAVLCRDRLVRTACGEVSGQAAFQLAKLSAFHPRHTLRCNVSSIDQYRGFTYSPQCRANFTLHMGKCYDDHLRMKMILFNEDNDLIAAGGQNNVKLACKNYKKFTSCMKPISETCADGIKLVFDMDGRWRTYLLKMDYICHQSNEEYIGNLDCLQQTVVNETLRVCNPIWYDISSYFNDITAYQFYCRHNRNGTVPQKLHAGLQELRNCYARAFTDYCSNVTGDVMDGLMQEVFHDPFYLRFRYKPRCNVNLKSATSASERRKTAEMQTTKSPPAIVYKVTSSSGIDTNSSHYLHAWLVLLVTFLAER